jgi:G:T-mismatch repair DNA endonuclease (very short patch repair protein)
LLLLRLLQPVPQVYGRAVRIAVSLGGFIARVARDAALGQLEERSGVRAVELRKLLSGLGPSFVKIGQALSARPDLLPQVRRGSEAGCKLVTHDGCSSISSTSNMPLHAQD